MSPLATQTIAAIAICLALPAGGHAQVWLPDPREGSVSITAQGAFTRDHLDRSGKPYDRGRITTGLVIFGAEYGLNKWFSLGGSLTMVTAKHTGADSLHGPLDTGVFHGSAQDARMSVAIRLPAVKTFTVTPFLGTVLPTHDYETSGHSAPGKHLRALELGVGLGRDLGSFLPNAYVQGQLSHSFVENVGGFNTDRTNIDVEAGYALTTSVVISAAGALQRTRGGVLFPLPRDENWEALFPFHDRVSKANHFVASVGATTSIGRISVFGSVFWTVWGENTHKARGFSVGLSREFRRGIRLGG